MGGITNNEPCKELFAWLSYSDPSPRSVNLKERVCSEKRAGMTALTSFRIKNLY